MTFIEKLKWMGITSLCLTLPGGTWAKTLTVGAPNTSCPKATYSTISDAVTSAQNGDRIEICPALYAEQVVITKPLTLIGIAENGVGRVLIRPASLVQPTLAAPVGTLPFIAVISVLNTSDVDIANLAIDASNNAVSGCTIPIAGIHFYNASGTVESAAITGTALSNPISCTTLFPGNGFGVQADQDAGATGPFKITVLNSSIHDFGRNAVLVSGTSEIVDISGNQIEGIGPSTGVNQFGVFLANGVTGKVTGNTISQGNCGSVPLTQCIAQRSEGVVLRAAGDGVVVSKNSISHVQAGVFVNGATKPQVSENRIANVDALNGIQVQNSISGVYRENQISHAGNFSTDPNIFDAVCGLSDVPGSGSSGNTFAENSINDAYCGVGYITTDHVGENLYLNTLFETLNFDTVANPPPPVEPGQ